jgi:glycosyltransferase involved in cell wall biosynthesis
MRILDIGPWIAYPPERGRAVRAYNLLRRLAVRHDVRQWGRGDARLRLDRPLLEEVPVTPMFRVYRNRYPLAARAQQWLLTRQVPHGLLETAARRLVCPPRLLELLDWAGVILAEDPSELALCRRERPDGRFAYVAHDVGGPGAVSATGHDLLAEAVSSVELVIALSSTERQELIDRYSLDAESVVEVPNGADVAVCRPVDEARRAELRAQLGLPHGPLAVFVGSATPANRAALGWIRRLASMSGHVTFVVVGSVAASERGDGLIVTGPVTDVVPYLQAADAALCPVEHATGTLIKLFEGLACGLATVAFAETIRGTALQAGTHVVVSEKTERALLAALEELAADREAASEIGAAGRAFVAERHTWDELATRLDVALRSRFDPEYGRDARHTFATASAGP